MNAARQETASRPCRVRCYFPLALKTLDLEACLLRAYAELDGQPCHLMDAPGSCVGDSLCVAPLDGAVIACGEADRPATLMSAAKPFLLLHALETQGVDQVRRRVGCEASAFPYHSLEQLRADGGRPRNAMLNSGAMVLASLLPGGEPSDRATRFADWLRQFVPGAALVIDDECLAEVLTPGEERTNQELVRALEAAGAIVDAPAVYEAYFRVCCMTVSVRELAALGRQALLHHPAAGEVLAQMAVGGLYEASGEWWARVGCPAKSAVSGLFFAVAPGRAVVAAGSPWLDETGNPLVPMVAVADVCGRIQGPRE